MKIVVLGATGACGRHVVRQALDRGYEVVAYVRRPDAVEPRDRLRVVGGGLDDVAAMTAVFKGADAVISCIGLKLDMASIGRANLMDRVMPKILDAADASGAKRFVLMSAFGVGDTARKASGLARVLYSTLTRAIFDDKARSEKALARRRINWTVIYPVMLFEGPRAAGVTVAPLEQVTRVRGLPKVPYDNVASVLLDLAGRSDFSGMRLLVTA